jgi:hypothetical protein
MDDTTVTLTLPSELVRRATEEGLLTPERVSEWLADELMRNQAANRLFANLDKLRAAASDLTSEDLDAELDNYYTEKHGSDS